MHIIIFFLLSICCQLPASTFPRLIAPSDWFFPPDKTLPPSSLAERAETPANHVRRDSYKYVACVPNLISHALAVVGPSGQIQNIHAAYSFLLAVELRMPEYRSCSPADFSSQQSLILNAQKFYLYQKI